MAETAMSITKMHEDVVLPILQTPNHDLYLSELDQWFPINMSMFCVYEPADEQGDGRKKNPASVIKEALAKVLAHYYPLAGRLKEVNDEEVEGRKNLEVQCNAKGVIFAEAKANCSLADVCYLREEYHPSVESSLFLHIDPLHTIEEKPLLTMQVTSFKCGGFVIGIKASHALIDAEGQSMFLNALGEIARKGIHSQSPSLPVVWERKRLSPRRPPQFKESIGAEAIPIDILKEIMSSGTTQRAFVLSTFEFSQEFIQKLKDSVVEESQGSLSYCSTFEALVAFIQEKYAKAMGFRPSAMGITLAVNTRNAMKNVISGEGYYGNCVLNVSVKPDDLLKCNENIYNVTEDERFRMVKKSDVVKCIREAKSTVTEELVKSIIDYLHTERGRKVLVAGSSMPEGLFVNDWSRYNWVPDLGVGKQLYVTISDLYPVAYLAVLPKVPRFNTVSVSLTLPELLMPIFKTLVKGELGL